MKIRKGDTRRVTKNFKYSEFYSKSPDAPEEHYLNDKLVTAAQLLRDWFEVPVRVNSSYRTKNHNKSVGGGAKSQHLLGQAIDLSFPGNKDIQKKYNEAILDKGELFKSLRALGINGFGLYDNFLHIDARDDGGIHTDEFGSYAFWDNRTYTKKKTKITDFFKAVNDEEDGNLDNVKLIDGTILFAVLVIVAIAIFLYKKYGW